METQLNSELEALESFAATLVGTVHVWEAQDRLKRSMLIEALRRTTGNYSQCALQLGVKRQAVQQMVNRFELEGWTARLRLEKQL